MCSMKRRKIIALTVLISLLALSSAIAEEVKDHIEVYKFSNKLEKQGYKIEKIEKIRDIKGKELHIAKAKKTKRLKIYKADEQGNLNLVFDKEIEISEICEYRNNTVYCFADKSLIEQAKEKGGLRL